MSCIGIEVVATAALDLAEKWPQMDTGALLENIDQTEFMVSVVARKIP